MARPRKTKKQHQRDGSFRTDRHYDTVEDSFTEGTPEPPRKLSKSEKEIWDLVIQQLPKDQIGKIDGPALYGLVIWWKRWQAFDDRITELEADPETKLSTLYNATIMSVAAWKQCEKLLGKFGMSPRDRTLIREIKTVSTKETNPFEDFLARSNSQN